MSNVSSNKSTLIGNLLLRACPEKENTRIGDFLYYKISETLLLKMEVFSCKKINQYDSIKCTIISTLNGIIDSCIIKFSDVFSPKIVAGKIIYNYIWYSVKDYEWFLKEPSLQEFNNLRTLVENYISLFYKGYS